VPAQTLFDAYLMVDWSAANTRKLGRDSIWFCHLERRNRAPPVIAAHENPATRHAAYLRLHQVLCAALAERRSVLVGFDFPFGYVGGLAARLGIVGPPWRGIWDTIAGLLVDHDDNSSNRFAVAAEFNRRISGGPFPFWGCPARQANPYLAMTHYRRHEAEGLPERRLSDRRLRRLQPGWKLAGTGSAGSQALTGIPIVRRLRDDPMLRGNAKVWPYETELRALSPDDARGRIIFAEIYPSLLPPVLSGGEVKDAAQVRTIATYFADLDERGELAALFAGDPRLSEAERRLVEREEGWVLGIVGGPAESPSPRPACGRGRNRKVASDALARVREREGPTPPGAGG
jgi:precorrin-8X/cobalt-precorrin-8 methylmutase